MLLCLGDVNSADPDGDDDVIKEGVLKLETKKRKQCSGVLHRDW